MSENIQDENDELFRNAYNSLGEDPGPEVWEKLNAQLDKKDAVYYRAKTAVWKRSAYALLILLTCFVSYEFLFKTEKKTHQEINTDENKKQSSFDSSETNNLTPPAQKTLRDSLQLINKTKSSSLLSQSKATNKANSSQALSKANESSAREKGTLYKQEIIAKNRTNISGINVKKTVQESEKTIQNTELQVDQFFNGEKKISKPNTSAEELNETIASNNKKDSFSIQNQAASQNKIAKTNTNTIVADNNNTVMNQNEKKTGNTEKKLDSSAVTNIAKAAKTSIKINHLFKPHWSFSPYAALDFSGQRLDDDDNHPEPGNRDARHDIEERENEQLSYSVGAFARYQLSKTTSLKTGLVYINSSVRIDPQTLYASANGSQGVNYKLITSCGYAYVKPSFDQSPAPGDSIYAEHANNQLSYLSIPFMASYTIHTGNKFTIIPGIGFSTNILLHSKISTEVHGNDENEKSSIVINKMLGLDRLNFSFIADAELHYKIANKWSLLLLPSFKYAINPITKEHVVKTYPYNFGLGFGVTYGL